MASCAGEGKVDLLVQAEGVVVTFGRRGLLGVGRQKRMVRALNGATFAMRRGESLALVGETGSGKTTLGRCIVGRAKVDHGQLLINGRDVSSIRDWKVARRAVQMVVQDPYGAFDPTLTVGTSVREPLDAYRIGSRAERRARVIDVLSEVGLDPTFANRRPGELSGGQRQRAALARALALRPDFIIADEPTSALDVSIQAQIIDLMARLRDASAVTFLLITHNLAIVPYVADSVGVMYSGRVVELGPVAEVLDRPKHPYTAALLAAAPTLSPRKSGQLTAGLKRSTLGVVQADARVDARGCGYRSKCQLWQKLGRPDICATVQPESADGCGRRVECHFPSEALDGKPNDGC